MTISALCKRAEAAGIPADQYAEVMLAKADNFNQHQAVWSAYGEGLRQEVEHWRGKYRAERGDK